MVKQLHYLALPLPGLNLIGPFGTAVAQLLFTFITDSYAL